MDSSTIHALLQILVMAAVTIAIRFAPFVLFEKHTPKAIVFLGEVLPFAVIAMLVVFCLKNVNVLEGNHGIPELIAVVLVATLHKWKHNTLLSILAGTISYMLMLQFLF